MSFPFAKAAMKRQQSLFSFLTTFGITSRASHAGSIHAFLPGPGR